MKNKVILSLSLSQMGEEERFRFKTAFISVPGVRDKKMRGRGGKFRRHGRPHDRLRIRRRKELRTLFLFLEESMVDGVSEQTFI